MENHGHWIILGCGECGSQRGCREFEQYEACCLECGAAMLKGSVPLSPARIEKAPVLSEFPLRVAWYVGEMAPG